MGFLSKIKENIKKRAKSSFRETVEKEKKGKYLLGETSKTHTKPGEDSKSKKISGTRSSPFSRFIGEKIEATRDFAKEQEFYMKWIGLFLIASSLYIVFYSPYFLLSPSKVMIEALDDTVDVSIAYRSIEEVYGKNIFLIDKEGLAKTIQSYEKNISNIRIDHLYPNNLKILLTGQPIAFLLTIKSRPGEKWGLTDNGILVPYEKISSGSGLISLEVIDSEKTADELLDYRGLISSEMTGTITKILSTFSATWPALMIEKGEFLGREKELHVLLKNGTRIIFTLQDFTRKAGEGVDIKYLTLAFIGLKTFIEDHDEDMSKGAYTYIDARIPERIFSCRDRVLCKSNLLTIYPDLR